MKICLVTPAPTYSRKGNRVTALRWARILRELDHRVSIVEKYQGERCDSDGGTPCPVAATLLLCVSGANTRSYHSSSL